MSEIRPLRACGFDAYVDLLCASFGYTNREHVATILKQDPTFDPKRILCLYEGKRLASIVTSTTLQFGSYRAVALSGVATAEEFRGRGFASKLVQEALTRAKRFGVERALTFAKTTKLYEQGGFKVLDACVTAPFACDEPLAERPMEDRFVRMLYDRWAEGHDDRLRRDDKCWSRLSWMPSECLYQAAGYARATRTGVISEVVNVGAHQFALVEGSTWFGLESLATALSLPLGEKTHAEYLLGIGFERAPQFFRNEF